MNPDEVKKWLEIQMAVWKYDMTETIQEIVTKALEKQRSDEVARLREREY